MKYRYIALIALWTILSGPIFSTARPRSSTASHLPAAPVKAPAR